MIYQTQFSSVKTEYRNITARWLYTKKPEAYNVDGSVTVGVMKYDVIQGEMGLTEPASIRYRIMQQRRCYNYV